VLDTGSYLWYTSYEYRCNQEQIQECSVDSAQLLFVNADIFQDTLECVVVPSIVGVCVALVILRLGERVDWRQFIFGTTKL
jgi:hypothetical protein